VIRGTSIHPADTDLAARARELLVAGPMDSVSLVAQVCRMSGAPALVAEHLATTLFAGRGEFARDMEGRWRLVDPKGASRVGERSPGYGAEAASHGARSPGTSPGSGLPSALAAQPELPFAEFAGLPVRPPVARRRIETALHTLDFVVVDVETTGGGSLRADRITEVAAVHVRNGVVVEEFETLVNPQRSIPPMITALTNISWEMVRHAPRFAEICDRLIPMLAGKVFVAHNAEFDWRFVTAEIARATGQRLEGERLCTVRLARKLLPELRSRRLDALAHYYGITIEGRHRAGGDARATVKVLAKLLRELADRDCLTFEAMRDLLSRRARGKRGRRGRRGRAMPRGMDRDASA
jgi:DNA polymerase-3 subunit epsilon